MLLLAQTCSRTPSFPSASCRSDNHKQTKTALADTPGSKFAAEATKLVEAARFDELVALLSGHVDLICGAAAPKGAFADARRSAG